MTCYVPKSSLAAILNTDWTVQTTLTREFMIGTHTMENKHSRSVTGEKVKHAQFSPRGKFLEGNSAGRVNIFTDVLY